MLSYSGCPEPRGISRTGLLFVIAAHVLVALALLRLQVIPLPAPLAVLNVSLLAAATPPAPEPKIEPPRPRPVEKRPQPRPQPVPAPLAAPEEAPAPAASAPVAIPAAPPAPSIALPAPPAPALPTQPRFDADYLDNPKPAYPAISRRMGEEGKVVLRVQVAASGLPTEVTLHAGSGSPRLDQVALETVRRWKFVPARLGDEAVAASVLVPIVFSLKG